MDQLKAPDRLNFDSPNLSQTWKKWREEFTLYADLALADKDDKHKVKMFRYLIGNRGREVYDTLTFVEVEDERTLQTVIEKFDAYCNPMKNESVERYKFNSRNQQPGESIYNYVTELKLVAANCGYGEIEESLIRDRIVCGIKDTSLRERLLRETNLTLKSCLDICRASELSKERMREIDNAPAAEVHALRTPDKGAKMKYDNRQYSKGSVQIQQCRYCGRKHELSKQKCPAYGQVCHKCKKKDHFAVMCGKSQPPPQQSPQKRNNKQKRVHYVHEDSVESDLENDYFEIATVSTNSNEQIYAMMHIEGKPVRFQLDSGASCNVIPISMLNGVGYKIAKSSTVLTMYDKSQIKPIGKTTLALTNPKNQSVHQVDFIVVQQKTTPILGNPSIQMMQLVTINYDNILHVAMQSDEMLTENYVFTQYSDVFEGTGCLAGTYRLKIDPEVQPVIHPPRKIPVSLREKLKTELERLTEKEIIAPVTEPTPWVNNLVIVEKPNKLRICLDPRNLNKAIQRSHYPMPTVEELLPDLNKARVFSVADAKNGFWHVKLDTESSMLTTFNTPHGRFRWLRMPFGLNSAPEEFQRRQNQTVDGLPGVRCVHDDILIFGEGETDEIAIRDHDRNFKALMERCRERNLKLNKDKLKFKRKEVKFVGHLLTSNGVRADPDKVKAVMHMPTPTDVSAVRRFVGFITYLSKFLPRLSDLCEPLRKLTVQNAEWSWLDTHERAVTEIKRLVCTSPVLKYYDPKEELTLQCDASLTGLGASLLQNGQPIAFASRALTNTETRYAQIEKEMLAVVFGLERFHQYTYGRVVNVDSDHKPLESIVKKSLLAAPRRLQRMMLRLQQYDYAIRYKPGNTMYIADTLSRAYLKETDNSDFEKNLEIVNMVQYLPMTESRLSDIRKHTCSDESLQVLKDTILQGWPLKRENCSPLAKPYFDFRDELSVQDGILLRGERAIVPKTLRTDMMQRVHSSHIGIGGCLRRAKECMYWPGMQADITQYIESCETCQMYENKQQKETLNPHEVPDRPWAKIGTDLCSFDGKDYLVTVDYFSNFWEIDFLETTKPKTVIRKLRALFARYGIPDTVISDNGPHFSCKEFEEFAKRWEFEHVTSSPTYPQSNGKAEQAVKTVKRLMKRARKNNEDIYLSILDFRNTPTEGMSSSPAQRLMSRRTKTRLPTTRVLLKPHVQKSALKEIQRSKEKQCDYYNRNAKDLSELEQRQRVWLAPKPNDRSKTWTKGTVNKKVNIRSYEVFTDEGQTLRRNRRDIRIRKCRNGQFENVRPNDVNIDEYVTEPDTENVENTPKRKTVGSLPSRVDTPVHANNDDRRPSSDDPIRTSVASSMTRSGREVKFPQKYKDFDTG